MKVSLVVASGVHAGKAIPIPGAQFVIGRDEGCQLRPASPAVSKKHCAIVVREGAVFVRDMGSTNGTVVNDEVITAETAVKAGDRLKVGPLEFTVQVTKSSASDATPLPDALKTVAAGGAKAKPPTPGSGLPSLKPPAPKPAEPPAPKIPSPVSADDADHAAALLLGMDDESPAEVPDGGTVTDMPAPVIPDAAADGAKPAEKRKSAAGTGPESSAAASDLLRQYMRRPNPAGDKKPNAPGGKK